MHNKTIPPKTTTPKNNRWVSAYIFHQLSFEQLIAECLHPLLESIRCDDRINNCFFIRYWEEGTHLRLRLQLKKEDMRTETEDLIRRKLETYFRQIEQDAAGYKLKFVPYQPEYQRYGGRAFIESAERHFADSSKIIADLIAENYSQWDYSLALGFALQMDIAFAKAIFDNTRQSSAFFRSFYKNWLPYSIKEEADGGYTEENILRTRQFFQTSYEQQKDRILQLIQVTQRATRSECRQNEWYRACRHLKTSFQQTRKIIDLSAPPWFVYHSYRKVDHATQIIWSIYESFIHMTHNRLGIYLRDEAFLAYLLYQGFEELHTAVADT